MNIQKVDSNYSGKQIKNYKPAFKRNWAEHVSWGAKYIKESDKTNFKLFSFPDAKAVLLETTKKTSVMLSNMWERLVKVNEPEKLAAATSAGAIAAISTMDDDSKLYPMENKGDGVFELNDVELKPNDGYRFVVINKDGKINTVKDPYAKRQENIHGWSTVYDQNAYQWKNTDWIEGKDDRRIKRDPSKPLRGLGKLIIDEINIPTVSKEGTFEAAKARIDVIADRKNATAIEIMPVEGTYSLQWGYDGVDKFAVSEPMGGPDKLKELIDYAHGKGLNVIMDMVPNHVGTDGNYLSITGPYKKCCAEFGDKFNYEGTDNRYVRDYMVNAALWWANEFKVDGLRFDLTKETDSDWLLRQIVVEMNEHNPDVFLIAEDHNKKRHSITSYYKNNNLGHEDIVNYIDNQVDAISKGFPPTMPWSIGFDSEWDSQYKDAVKDMALMPNDYLLDILDNLLKSSHYRLHYAYSHDEIGNEDGTRFIPKYIARHLNLYMQVSGNSDAEKGQKAAQAAQKLAELVVSDKFDKINDIQLHKKELELGLNQYIDKNTLREVFMTAVAKQKLMLGTIYTTPGPKMFFQGDDEADLSHFKFFREFSGDKSARMLNPNMANEIIAEKGYDTLEEVARPDSIIGRVKPQGLYKDLTSQMSLFSSDLRKVIDENKALVDGEIVSSYKDNTHLVHIHQLRSDDNELLIIKNFGHGFHNKSYSSFGFPQDGEWEEIFSSDDKKYGGIGYKNSDRESITNVNQNLSLAPNSFIILRKVNKPE